MKTKSLIIAMTILLSTTIAVLANAGTRNECFDEIHSMRQDARNTIIIPQKTIWKEKIDKVISAEDKAELDKLRKEADQIRLAVVQKREEMADSLSGKGNRRAMRHHLREEHQPQMHAIVTSVKALMLKYETLNNDIITEKQKLNTQLYANRCESRQKFAEEHPECVKQFKNRNSRSDVGYNTEGNHQNHRQGRNHRQGGEHRQGRNQAQRSEISMVAIWLYNGGQSK